MFLKSVSQRYAGGQDRSMSTGVIAIIIASLSAIFTGLNMSFSALTYRRAKPKARWHVPNQHDETWSIFLTWQLTCYLVSMSSSAMTPLLIAHEYSNRPWRTKKTHHLLAESSLGEIPPMGMIEHEIMMDKESLKEHERDGNKYLRLVTVLPGAKRANSRWIRIPQIVRVPTDQLFASDE
jgi:hypothetical protein